MKTTHEQFIETVISKFCSYCNDKGNIYISKEGMVNLLNHHKKVVRHEERVEFLKELKELLSDCISTKDTKQEFLALFK